MIDLLTLLILIPLQVIGAIIGIILYYAFPFVLVFSLLLLVEQVGKKFIK